ncbi:hypothetical protein WG902_00980 [Ramlibacter sp. PS3R-8]|uniref:hypothetical protein n=1 Tax=Ramlibacter sp. PS3R-8 TaxID=3133437 RepID=UPI003096FC9B
MSAVLLPGGAVRTRRIAKRPARRPIAWLPLFVLFIVVLLEATALVRPQALQVHPLQSSVGFKQLSGYSMLVLMAFAMSFGWLRRLPLLAGKQALLKEAHLVSGLLILALLALHLVNVPLGYLSFVFHGMALAIAAGALRAVLGPRIGPKGCVVLLAVHIGLSCAVVASGLVHVYLVYAYTA